MSRRIARHLWFLIPLFLACLPLLLVLTRLVRLGTKVSRPLVMHGTKKADALLDSERYRNYLQEEEGLVGTRDIRWNRLRFANLAKTCAATWSSNDGIIVEIGCGMNPMMTKVSEQCLFVDSSLKVIRFLTNHGYMGVVAAAEYLPLRDESVQLLVSLGLIAHLRSWEMFLTESDRVLKQGGLVYIDEYNQHPAWGILPEERFRSHAWGFSYNSLEAAIQKHGFSIRGKGALGLHDRILPIYKEDTESESPHQTILSYNLLFKYSTFLGQLCPECGVILFALAQKQNSDHRAIGHRPRRNLA